MNRISQLEVDVVLSNGVIKKLLGAALAGACAAMAPAQAQAGIIDFEGTFGPTVHGDFIRQAGFDIGLFSNAPGAVAGEDLAGSFIDGADSTACDVARCPVNNPTMYYGALDDSYVDIMSSTSRAQFKVRSFDASFIGGNAALNTYPATAGAIRIQGFFAGGGSAIATFFLDGPAADGFNFSSYDTGAFGNLAFVEAVIFGYACDSAGSCAAFTNNRAQFGIDNISLAEVPEPSSFLLSGLGMIGMGAAARRRRRASIGSSL